MSGGITFIPTRTDGSAGRVKSDADPIEDLNTELPAQEYNVIADTVCGLANEVGLTNGTSPGSLVKRVTDIEAVLIPAPVKMPGALQQVVSVIGSEQVIGSFGAFDPTIYMTPTITLEATFVYVPATSGSIEIRLYDMGTRLAPTAGTLRSTISTTFADAGVLKCLSRALFVNASPGVNTDQIYNTERLYELRAVLIGATPGDSLQLGAVSLIVIPVIMGGPAAIPTAGYLTAGPEAGMPNERTFVAEKSLTATDNGPGASLTVSLVNDATTPGANKMYATNGAGVRGWRAIPATTPSVYTITVGNALAGDTLEQCDILDPGDGSGIAAAIVALYGTYGTIFVRRGVYTRPANAAVLDLYGSNIILRGDGVATTKIIGPAGDASTRPWQTLAISGASCTIQDLTIELPDRDAACPVAGTSLGVIAVGGPRSTVRNIRVQLAGTAGAWTAYGLPLAAIAYDFPSPSNIDQNLVEDVTFDTRFVTVTPHATQTIAFIGVSLGQTAGAPYPDAYPELPAVQAEPLIRRFQLIGQSSEAGAFPYYSWGVFMSQYAEVTILDSHFSGVSNGVFLILTSTVALVTTKGPVIERVAVHAADDLASAFIPCGAAVYCNEAGGTLAVSRTRLRGVEITGGGGTSTLQPGVFITGATSYTGVVLDDVQVTGKVAGNDGFVQVGGASGQVTDPILHAVRVYTDTAAADIYIGACLGANVSQCASDTLTVDSTATDTIITGCRVRDVGGYSDSGTGTSISNTIVG